MLICDFSLAQTALTAQNTCVISSTSARANNNSKQLNVRKAQIYHNMTCCIAFAAIKLLVGQQKCIQNWLDLLWNSLEMTFKLQHFIVVIYDFGC